MLYGFFNGARGIGYLLGGVAGVELLEVGGVGSESKIGYTTQYGTVILFTGLSAVLGGSGMIQKVCTRLRKDCTTAQSVS